MEPKTNPDVQETVNVIEKIKQNQKPLIGICIGIVALCVLFVVIGVINTNNSKKANQAVAIADQKAYTSYSAIPDSLTVAEYIKASDMGKKGGNRAKLHVAITYYEQGKYEEAIKYLNDADIESNIIEAGKYALMGDCYVNLKNLDKGLDCFKKAVKAADKNPQIVPFILIKEANIYRAQGKFAQEAEAYNTIIKEYPTYLQSHDFDIRKLAARAEAAAK